MVIFLTRKYPPSKGGMETFSYQLNHHYPSEHDLIHYGSKQRDVLWAIPVLWFRAWRIRNEATVYHLGDGVLTILAPLLRLFSRKPIVVTIHALEILYPSRLLQFCIRHSLKSVTHVVAVSEFTKRELLKYGVAENEITMIPHGAEHIRPLESSVQQFDEAKQHAKAALYSSLINHPLTQFVSEPQWMQSTILLSVGRLVKRKGTPWFIEHVLPSVLEESTKPVLYLIIGGGPELEKIRKLIETLHLQERVFLLGKVEQGILETSYTAADIFVMPNIHVPGDAEGFGFVAIEAAAAGLPVISSEIEGIPSAIHHSHNGILMEPGNTAAYHEALIHWIESPEDRIAFGYRASRYTSAHFRWNDMAQRYADLFESLLRAQ